MNLAEPFAETLEPRRERSLVGWWLFAITFLACVGWHASGHAFDTRDGKGKIATVPPPQGRADHTDWVIASQESVALRQVDESAAKS